MLQFHTSRTEHSRVYLHAIWQIKVCFSLRSQSSFTWSLRKTLLSTSNVMPFKSIDVETSCDSPHPLPLSIQKVIGQINIMFMSRFCFHVTGSVCCFFTLILKPVYFLYNTSQGLSRKKTSIPCACVFVLAPVLETLFLTLKYQPFTYLKRHISHKFFLFSFLYWLSVNPLLDLFFSPCFFHSNHEKSYNNTILLHELI